MLQLDVIAVWSNTRVSSLDFLGSKLYSWVLRKLKFRPTCPSTPPCPVLSACGLLPRPLQTSKKVLACGRLQGRLPPCLQESTLDQIPSPLCGHPLWMTLY